MSESHFKVKKITDFNDLQVDQVLPTSDFTCLTNGGKFVQLEYIEEQEKSEPYKVNPGLYTIIKTPLGLKLKKTSFVKDKVLPTYTITQKIVEKIDCFFNRLDVYAKHGIEIPLRAALLFGPGGCHAKGTEILMYDGSIKKVEDVQVGDLLMGPDSKPREVLKLAHGKEKMLKVTPVKGDSFVVNYNHIFHLTPTNTEDSIKFPINITGKDLYESSKVFKERFKLTRTGVDFSEKSLAIPPYILGTWLGDGTSETTGITSEDFEVLQTWEDYGFEQNLYMRQVNSLTYHLSSGEGNHKSTKEANSFRNNLKQLKLLNNKHIPSIYLTGNRQQRLELLAGLIDTDGSKSSNSSYDYITKSKKLAKDILYLCRSLGLAAYKKEVTKSCTYKGEIREGIYQRISISGDLCDVPVKLERKKCGERQQIKSVLRTGFDLELLPEDNFYGFALDGDHLYLTADFTIHHNTGKTTSAMLAVNNHLADGKTVVVLWPSDQIDPHDVKRFIQNFDYNGVEKLILIIEDIGGVEIDQVRMKSTASLLALLDNREKAFTLPTFIIATTNHAENFLGNITNRPGRFADKIAVYPPDSQGRKDFFKFFSPDASDELLERIAHKKFAEFTADHIKEVVIRSDLHGISIQDSMDAVLKEIQEYNKNFDQKKQGRMGISEYLDE